ncbi:MAG: hypothetical protein ACRDD7_06300 [Peptostreptococcaceae bacterium]
MEDEKVVSGRVMIDGTYYVRLEDRNFVLCKTRVTKSGNNAGTEVEDVVGYYTSIEGVFNRYLKEQIVNRSEGLMMDLKEFNKLLKEIRSDIKVIKEGFEI